MGEPGEMATTVTLGATRVDLMVDLQDTRPEPPLVAGERQALTGWLDYHRATLLWKCEGLDGEQLARRSVPPSTMSLLGLVRHMTEVELAWFDRVIEGRSPEEAPFRFCGDGSTDDDFDAVDAGRAGEDLAAFAEQLTTSREILARHDLDQVVHRHRTGERLDVRHIVVHMIEEYARHNGHADLLRECLDGAVGD
jgi:uncharacterized damage-inducible protein DinB